MTPAGIEPATFRFVAQRLNHCATAVPQSTVYKTKIYTFFQSASEDLKVILETKHATKCRDTPFSCRY